MTEIDKTTILAHLVRKDDGYHVIDSDGTIGPVCNKCTSDGYIILTPNASNRKCYNKKNADAFFDANPDGTIDFVYKPSRQAGTVTHYPNEKLIKYLPEDLQQEYYAMMQRAVEAKAAAKKVPLSPLEKAEKALAKAQAKYDALVSGMSETEED